MPSILIASYGAANLFFAHAGPIIPDHNQQLALRASGGYLDNPGIAVKDSVFNKWLYDQLWHIELHGLCADIHSDIQLGVKTQPADG